MLELQSDYAQISDTVTHSVRVEVMSKHSPENSRPASSEWVFQYTVRITNQGAATVQLISRHWIIKDALDRVEEIRGRGVVGEQPVIIPGDSFKYSSWCPLRTPTGIMRGVYRMIRADGAQFDVEIAPFALKVRSGIH